MIYELAAGDVVARDGAGNVRWRGRPDGFPTMAIVPLPDTEDAVVLLDYMAGPKNFSNLLRIRPDGTIVWRAAPPELSTNDAYVECRWRGDSFYANSWSGCLVEIDLETGVRKSTEFVK